MKKIFSVVLCVSLMLGCLGFRVSAQEVVYPKVLHELTTTEDFSSDEWETVQKGAYLGNGVSSIGRADRTHIHISGSTNATQKCDKVMLTLFVERSTSYGTGYGTYKKYHYSAENVYALAKEVSNISVERGYYYRVKGVHSVTHNGTQEITDSVTDPIDYR